MFLEMETIEITSNLDKLKNAYDASLMDTQLLKLLCKSAVIEFCGWLEVVIDDIALHYLDSKVLITNEKNIAKKYIKENYGFDLDKNIRKIFMIALGASNWENVWDKLSISDKSVLESTIRKYKSERDGMAHTYYSTSAHISISRTPSYLSPHTVLADFRAILPVLQKIETETYALI